MADSLIRVAYSSPRAAGKLIIKINAGHMPHLLDYISTLPAGLNDQRGLINRRYSDYLEGAGIYIQVQIPKN